MLNIVDSIIDIINFTFFHFAIKMESDRISL